VWATLYCDASFSPNDGGAWACWLRSDAGRDISKGICPPHIIDSNLAEMHAVLEGIVRARSIWGNLAGILVKTDSQTAVNILKFRAPKHRRRDYAALQTHVVSALAPNVRIRMQWTPGHQHPDTTAAWINDRVDNLARDARTKRP
jgi:ribonuclease HI